MCLSYKSSFIANQCRQQFFGSSDPCVTECPFWFYVLCSFLRYRIYDLPHTLYTKPVWKIVNPQIEESVQFTALNASQEFLNYLQTNALIIDLWGLQGTKFASLLHVAFLYQISCQHSQGCRGGGGGWSGLDSSGQEPSAPASLDSLWPNISSHNPGAGQLRCSLS